MNNKSKGQKLFLLAIISVICIFAFCMAGCNLSCFGCDVACDYEDESLMTGINNSCTTCGNTNSCGTGCAGYAGEDGISSRIAFLTDSYDKKHRSTDCSNYGTVSCYIDFDNEPGCSAYCGSFNSEDGATESYFYSNKEGSDTGCAEQSNCAGMYYYLKSLMSNLFD